jgi:hypothetical protein
VFVGFGALISIRSGGAMEAHEVTYIRVVVWTGLWVVMAALAPVIISGYGIAGHEVWAVCSVVALVLFWSMWMSNRRSPEHRVDMAAYTRAQILEYTVLLGLLVIPLNAALILIVLGLFPNQEPALYLTAVVLTLFMGAVALLGLVYSQARPETASDPAAEPAAGGSSA